MSTHSNESFLSGSQEFLDVIKKASPPDRNSELIELVNWLQNKLAASGHNLDISLPQIVVVGCQSAGKSSVLENIVGKEFLPRGSGVVTRRPTIVQIDKSDEEYAEFLHKPGVKFKDFGAVKGEIQNETERDPGFERFSSVPISLKIFLPNALKLTFVDLPGLIRVTVENQSENSVEEIRKMVLSYIGQPYSLILAVTPANQDLANSDALEMAKIVDPKRVRTIGVLTKLDLMDEGTNAREILENKKIPLKRGYIGVLNRSQRDIEEEKDFDFILQKEKNFFESKPFYKQMADRMGTPYLKKFLNQQLYLHIKESLPKVRQELAEKLHILRKEMNDIYAKIGCKSADNFNAQSYMIKLLQEFVDGLHRDLFGFSEKVSMDELSVGSKINKKLCHDASNLKLPKIPDETKLASIIANLHGVRNSMSLPSLALEAVVSHLLPQYTNPLNNMVNGIGEILQTHMQQSCEQLESYLTLRNEVLYIMSKHLQDAIFNTKETLEKHMKAEMYFVNTYHKDFIFPETGEKLFPMEIWNEREDGLRSGSESGRREKKMSAEKRKRIHKRKKESEYRKALNDYTNFISASPGVNLSSHLVSPLPDVSDDEFVSAENTEPVNKCVTANADYLAKTIERYLVIQKKHVEDTAIKYILYFLVKNVMDFIKAELIPTVLASDNYQYLLEDCTKDFNKTLEIKAAIEYIEEALKAVEMF